MGVLKQLESLVNETDTTKLNNKLSHFLDEWTEKYPIYSDYFQANWIQGKNIVFN